MKKLLFVLFGVAMVAILSAQPVITSIRRAMIVDTNQTMVFPQTLILTNQAADPAALADRVVLSAKDDPVHGAGFSGLKIQGEGDNGFAFFGGRGIWIGTNNTAATTTGIWIQPPDGAAKALQIQGGKPSAAGTAGGNIVVAGGDASTATGAGAAGGAATFRAGNASAAAAGSDANGATGGSITLQARAGSAGDGTGNGGLGGTTSLTALAGGAGGATSGNGARGGAGVILAGNGGAAVAGTAGDGGPVSLTAGSGGNGGVQDGSGGSVFLVGGVKGAGAGTDGTDGYVGLGISTGGNVVSETKAGIFHLLPLPIEPAFPAVSAANSVKLFYDGDTDRTYFSEHGGAYQLAFGNSVYSTNDNVTADSTMDTILMTASSKTITLPAPGTVPGKIFHVVNVGGALTTLDADVDIFDENGLSQLELPYTRQAVTIQSDGVSSWVTLTPPTYEGLTDGALKVRLGNNTFGYLPTAFNSAGMGAPEFGATNHVVDLILGSAAYRTLIATNDVHLIHTTNRIVNAAQSISLQLMSDGGGDRTVSWNTSWWEVGTTATSFTLTNDTMVIVNVTHWGLTDSETNVTVAVNYAH